MLNLVAIYRSCREALVAGAAIDKKSLNSQRNLIEGIDSIRFVCAFWVVVSHLGEPPLMAGVDKTNLFAYLLNGFYNNIISGPAAVIVFFVVSGFCIHLPNATSHRIKSKSVYYSQRFIRIGLPMIFAIGIAKIMNVNLTLFENSILWSLFAELVYYTIYPSLLYLRRFFASWLPLLLCTFVAALIIVGTNPSAGNYPSYGIQLNWLLGLPCWLVGCHIAEKVIYLPAQASASIWTWRSGIWLASISTSILRFHSPVGYPWTLNFFALLVGFWLIREILYFRRTKPVRLMEWGGKWSYSMYLVHILAIKAFAALGTPNIGYLLNWLLAVGFILATSVLFAVLIEFPSHRLARHVGIWLTGRRAANVS